MGRLSSAFDKLLRRGKSDSPKPKPSNPASNNLKQHTYRDEEQERRERLKQQWEDGSKNPPPNGDGGARREYRQWEATNMYMSPWNGNRREEFHWDYYES